jgi:hypothetical protein
MKPIEITKQQKDKLLEMCKALFSEYKYIQWDNQDLDIGSPLGYEKVNQFRISNHIFISKTKDAPHDDGIFIHWFEFCFNVLLNKINYPSNQINNSKLITDNDLINANHPIDYLYNEFKKLKK